MEKNRKYKGQITHKKPKYCRRYEHRQYLTNTNHGGNPGMESEWRDSHERLGSVTKTMPELVSHALSL